MKHFNGNLPCAVDIRTTGNTPGIHDLIELAVVPLTAGFALDKELMPFHMNFTTRHDPSYKDVPEGALLIDSWVAEQTFINYYKNLGLKTTKRIQMLTFNAGITVPFLTDWFGVGEDRVALINDYFDLQHTRDMVSTASYLNDLAYRNSLNFPISKLDFAYLCRSLKVTNWRPWAKSSCLERAIGIASCWNKCVQQRLTHFDIDIWLPENIDYSDAAYGDIEDE